MEETNKEKSLVQKSRDFIDQTLHSLKGEDLNSLVETYTREVTLVLEGMHEDMVKTIEEKDELAARQTLLEDDQKKLTAETRQALDELGKKLDRLQKKNEEKQRQGRINQALTKALWIVGILSLAWTVNTLLKLLVK